MAINGAQRRSPGLGGCTHFSLSCMQSRAIEDNQGHSRAIKGNQGQSRALKAIKGSSCRRADCLCQDERVIVFQIMYGVFSTYVVKLRDLGPLFYNHRGLHSTVYTSPAIATPRLDTSAPLVSLPA